jgi:hypothetical protein
MTAVLALFVAGCSDSTGSGSGTTLAIRFATSPGARASVSGSSSGLAAAAADALTLTGSNGTLVIDDVRLTVSKLWLEQASGTCTATGDDAGGDCEKFQGGPFLVDLPLSSGTVTLATTDVPAGTYSAFQFNIETLQASGAGDAEQATKQQLLSQIRATYPQFPEAASMVVHGTFTPTGGTAQTFTVYFRSEIEVERTLSPPVTVPGTSGITVDVNPAAWFKSGTTVTNLAAFNGQTLNLGNGFENAFDHIEQND